MSPRLFASQNTGRGDPKTTPSPAGLQPPRLREADRLAQTLNSILLIGFGLSAVLSVTVMTFNFGHVYGLGVAGGIILLHLITLGMVLLKRFRLASLFLPAALWVVVSIIIYVTGGNGIIGLTGYLIVTITAGLLLGTSAAASYVLLSLLTSLVFLFLEISRALPPAESAVSRWVIQATFFIWITALLYVLNKGHRMALERAYANEADLEKINQEQQVIQASLESHAHQLERRITQLQAAGEVARDAAALIEVDELLNRVVNLVRERFGFYHAGIFMLDERGDYAVLRAATGDAGKRMLKAHHKLKVGEVGIVGYVTGSGLPRVALDVGKDPTYFRNPFLPDTRSEMALPLKTAQSVIGALDVQSKDEAAFENEDLLTLQAMADQLAIAIQNARLYQAARRQVEELTILHAVATAGAEVIDQDTLIERATQLIGDTLFPVHFGVLLLDEKAGVLRFHASYRGISAESKRQTFPLGRSIIGRVASQGKSMRVSDVTRDPAYIDVHAGMRSELCVPMKIGEGDTPRVVGVINAENGVPNGFTEADERLLATFAGQLATALEKVRLFEIERRRATELEALRQASLHLTSNLELQPVLDSILNHATGLVGADSGHLFLFDGEKLTFGTALWTANRARRPGQPPQTAELVHKDPAAPVDATRPHGLTYTVARTGKRVVVPDTRQHPLFRDDPRSGAVVGLPLRRGDQIVGVMDISFEGGARSFDENELRVLELLADQAAIAVVNARLYAEAQQRAKELATALAQREELDRLKSEFIQNVSHELRTPLAIARGYVELLHIGQMGDLNIEQQKALDIIHRRVNMLNKLVDDLTAILESEAHETQAEPIYLSDLAQKAVEDFKSTFDQAGLQLKTEITPDLPALRGNAAHLYRVLDNLIGNAVKFTPKGGQVVVRLWQEGIFELLEVADTGVGIPANQLERIFERFYQVDGSTTRRYGGTGLGLALVKEIAEAHGGKVSVQSTLGNGSCFTVHLPILDITL